MVDGVSGEFGGNNPSPKDAVVPESVIAIEYGVPPKSINLKESFEPFLNRTLKDGGILEWKRTDLSQVGKVMTYMEDGVEEEYEITESAGVANVGIYDEGGIKIAICDSFEIAEDLQGGGLGRKLWTERVEPKTKEYKVKEIKATHVMADSQGFWRKMGFIPAGENSRTWVKKII